MQDNKLAYTDGEITLIKKLFAGNDALLMAIRNHMLQFGTTDEEKKVLSTLGEPEIALLTKVFAPRANRENSLGKIGDIWGSIDTRGMSPDQAYPHYLSRELVVEYITQQLGSLGKTKDYIGTITLESMVERPFGKRDPLDLFVGVNSRNTLFVHIDHHLNLLKIFAGKEEESVEDAKKRLLADSSK
jgi:hypothetical protein